MIDDIAINERVRNYYWNNYLAYQMAHGDISRTEMAKLLNISAGYFVWLIKGRRSSVSLRLARNSVALFGDREIMEIMGFEENPDSFTQAMQIFSPAFLSAIDRSVEQVVSMGLIGTPQADQIFVETLANNMSAK